MIFSFHSLLDRVKPGSLPEATFEDQNGEEQSSYEVVNEFSEVSFPAALLPAFKDFSRPTAIQSTTWAPLLRGRDLIGIASTGSGKTLAFSIPAIVHILNNPRASHRVVGPRVLILAPTRELAVQIASVCHDLGELCRVRSVCVYGGVPKHPQAKAIRDGAEIVIGTPGRIIDLVNDGALPLERVSFAVLDEADRMLDLGFSEDIKRIMGGVSEERQTLLFSATWPKEIQEFGRSFLKSPVKITIGSAELAAAHSVQQIVEHIDAKQKDRRLLELLRKYHGSRKNRVILFVLYKKEAVRMEQFLGHQGWNCVAIHGDKSQGDRSGALEHFKSGKVPLLIATDVAARGLDIPHVEYVINYSFPLTVEDYVHRIGRTGRAGATGVAHTFFTVFDKNNAGSLCTVSYTHLRAHET